MQTRRTFEAFWQDVNSRLFNHPVIVSNPYTTVFAKEVPNDKQVMGLFRQFSVFSNYFLVIQAKRMVFAGLEGEREARVILASELGVGLDVEKGEIDGNTFFHKHAHINWLRETGSVFGSDEVSFYGRWDIACRSTRNFLRLLEESYGSSDRNVGAGASFAVETWAAWGIGNPPAEGVGKHWQEENNFWKQLVTGLQIYNMSRLKPNDMSPVDPRFFQYHFEIERGHGASVMRELTETFDTEGFNETQWFQGGMRALDALDIFWLGLSEQWRHLR